MMRCCRELTRLISESMERPLTFWERVEMWMHFAMCGVCRRFSSDVQKMHDAAHHHAMQVGQETESDVRLEDDARQRIVTAVDDARGN